MILQLLKLPQIKVLHLLTKCFELEDESTDKYSELETCIAMNSTLLEIKLQYISDDVTLKTITSLINRVTGNKTITSFLLEVCGQEVVKLQP